MRKADKKFRRSGFGFLDLRKRYHQKQKDLEAQFQAELGQAGQEDVVTYTRLKLIYRRRGLNI